MNRIANFQKESKKLLQYSQEFLLKNKQSDETDKNMRASCFQPVCDIFARLNYPVSGFFKSTNVFLIFVQPFRWLVREYVNGVIVLYGLQLNKVYTLLIEVMNIKQTCFKCLKQFWDSSCDPSGKLKRKVVKCCRGSSVRDDNIL